MSHRPHPRCRQFLSACVAVLVWRQQYCHCMESSGPLSWGEQTGKLLTLLLLCIKIMQIILCLCVICGNPPGIRVCNPEINRQCLSWVCYEWLIAHCVVNFLLGQQNQKKTNKQQQKSWFGFWGGHLCTRNKNIGTKLKSSKFRFPLTENNVFVHHVKNWAKSFPHVGLAPKPLCSMF